MKNYIKKYMNDFLLYVQFFTRIPINIELECTNENFIRGSIFFPVIALIIGLIEYIVYVIMKNFFPSTIVAILVLITSAILTGALHMDGLGDVCDGFFAFRGGKGRIIEIMKDSQIGVYSCVAIIMDVLLKYNLISLAIESSIPELIIVAPVVGRLAIVFISTIGKPAKENGSGNIFIGKIKKSQLVLTIILVIALELIFINVREACTITLAVLIMAYGFNCFCNSKINGLTGDTLGAVNELAEVLALMVFFMI
ncbi:adenosylcobinamide-GDP ribazoletransferase [Clostridium senegalense]|uniref:adenosylcobinamide-GDP ribazoletransferase n=1 Tax=Clostridium senegalense TaxID=1465809 RepID=UPI001C124DAC|nr:adenosylcobinamide-GDP ribazoletransferase [Clostridium senegalense]MBU5226093.1 adenosylcobinamide-GDP ribazoletransferase [Clostridium senegalense]